MIANATTNSHAMPPPLYKIWQGNPAHDIPLALPRPLPWCSLLSEPQVLPWGPPVLLVRPHSLLKEDHILVSPLTFDINHHGT